MEFNHATTGTHPKTGIHHAVHKGQVTHTHATKVHWHTIEFSNNTSTPNNQAITAQPVKQPRYKLHTT